MIGILPVFTVIDDIPITAHDDPFLQGKRLQVYICLGPLESVSESTTPRWGCTIGRYMYIPRVWNRR